MKRKRYTAPTMADVALIAGVSTMTVSRVITGRGDVRDSTRDVVNRAIQHLGYTRHTDVRTESNTHRLTFVLLCRDSDIEWVAEILIGAIQEGLRNGISLTTELSVPGAVGLSALQRMIELGISGLILAPSLCYDTMLLEHVARSAIPFVTLGRSAARLDHSAVHIDDEQAVKEMTAHILGLGHRRIGFVVGAPDDSVTGERLRGYQRAMAAADLAVDPAMIVTGCDDYRFGLNAAETLQDLPLPPSAIFACSDGAAAAALAVAHGRGIEVPADLSVCGFGNSMLASALWPRLTTLRQPIADMARMAVRLLLQQILDGLPDRKTLTCTVIRRQSDCVPRANRNGSRFDL